MKINEILDRYPKELYKKAGSSEDYNRNVLNLFGLTLGGVFESPKVLDLASGTGEAADYLESTFAMRVVRADLSSDGLSLARDSRVRAVADCLPFPDDSFDGVHMKDALVHIPDVDKLLGEISRVLSPNGQALIVSAYPNRFGTFFYKQLGSTDQQWNNIGSQSDYLRHAERLMKDKKTAVVSPPYYSFNPSTVDEQASLHGLSLLKVSEWIPNDNSNWYNKSPRPVNRFVMHFEKR